MSLLYSLISPPAVTAVSLADCKADLRVENTNENDLIEAYIEAATKYCSEVVGRKLINETWKYSIDGLYGQAIKLPFNPVSSIVEIQYFDTDNVSQTVDVNNFYLYNFDQYSELFPILNYSFPSVYSRRDAINITFVAGYGATETEIPITIRKAIRLLVAHWYEVRTASTVGVDVKDIPFGVDALLGVERTGWCA